MDTSIVYDNEEVACWIKKIIGAHYYGYRTAGLLRGGEIVAGILCDRFGLTDCYVHIATRQGVHWAKPEYCAIAFGYMFNYLRRERISTETPVSRSMMVRVNRHLGWVQEGLKRCGADDGGDAIIFGMLRDECRWIKEFD